MSQNTFFKSDEALSKFFDKCGFNVSMLFCFGVGAGYRLGILASDLGGSDGGGSDSHGEGSSNVALALGGVLGMRSCWGEKSTRLRPYR